KRVTMVDDRFGIGAGHGEETRERASAKREQRPTKSTQQKRLWRVAIVGAGYIAETHAAVLRQLENSEIIAVVDIDAQRGHVFAATRNIPNVARSVDELIDRQVVDVAHVLVPPQSHMPVASRLLAARIH